MKNQTTNTKLHHRHMPRYLTALLLLFSACMTTATEDSSVFADKIICLDAGHGGTADTDAYRVGPSGEREEWINLRVAKQLATLLEAQGATVVMTRTSDTTVSLDERAALAVDQQADVFLSIHHNATADSSVNFPIVYYHGNASENQASVALGQQVTQQLRAALFHDSVPVSLASDHTIFPERGTAVLRGTYGIPAVIGEATFFTNPSEEERLKTESYNQREAQAYLQALEIFFSNDIPEVVEKYSTVHLPPFAALQEAERMRPEARLWRQDIQRGKELYEQQAWEEAYEYFTRSARSFPDSYLAQEAHRYRANILEALDSLDAAKVARQRANEYYVAVE